MIWLLTWTLLLAPAENVAAPSSPEVAVVLVVGEPGEAHYQKQFAQWAERWRTAATKSSAKLVTIGLEDTPQDRSRLEEALANLAKEPPQSLWLVLIGHGTFDGKKAKFNLRGTDISAAELAQALSPISCRMAIINCASASGPFVNQLSGPDRVVVAATQSGFEYNFARFGDFMSQAITDNSGDLDKDGQTSLLEAWLAAAKQTQTYYDSQSQLATEHALLDDNGDGKGTPADWFRGIYVTKSTKDGSIHDGTLANQFILTPSRDEAQLSQELIEQRDDLEQQLAELRQKKSQLSEQEYLDNLQAILVPLARLYPTNESSPDPEPKEDPPEESQQ